MSSPIAALGLWYRGDAFRGYQSQPRGPTVQQTLMQALHSCGIERTPVPSGRTDLGVHARMQVVSFRLDSGKLETLADDLNQRLGPNLGVVCARQAPPGFHAQWRASGKEYRYHLLHSEPSPFGWSVGPLDLDRLREALAVCVGTHDFIAFHESSSPRILRTLHTVEANASERGITLRLHGSGFARYMARYLVGGAVGVARGEIRFDDFRAGVLEAKSFAGIKAPAHGLTLWEVFYPPELDPFSPADRAGWAYAPVR